MSNVDAVQVGGDRIDLGGRIVVSTTVVASPAAAAETIIAQVTLPFPLRVEEVLDLAGWAAFTVGTSGTAVRLRLRRTNVAGAVVGDSGALTGGVAAAALLAQDVEGTDTTGAVVYALTLQVTAGAAPSTVSATKLRAIIF